MRAIICLPGACSYASRKRDVAQRFDDRALASRLVADNDELWKRRQNSADAELFEVFDSLNEAIRLGSERPESIMIIMVRLATVCRHRRLRIW